MTSKTCISIDIAQIIKYFAYFVIKNYNDINYLNHGIFSLGVAWGVLNCDVPLIYH